MDVDPAAAVLQASQPPFGVDCPQAIVQLATAYRVSQAIYVFTKLGIADLLAAEPKTSDELARAVHAHSPSLYRLLRALTAASVVAEPSPGTFALAPSGNC